MFKLIKNLFRKKKQEVKSVNQIEQQQTVSLNDYVDPKTGEVTKSAILYNKQNERLLKLDNDSCAIVMHPQGKVEVIFTKLYDEQEQRITPEEETLMSIAIFLNKPGFAELLRTEFHNIAMDNISKLTETEENNK